MVLKMKPKGLCLNVVMLTAVLCCLNGFGALQNVEIGGVDYVNPAWLSTSFTLVLEGQPNAVIVIGKDASEQAREAAGILQEFVEKISGAKLSIAMEGEEISGNCILVGHSKEVTKRATPPEGFTNNMQEEGYVIGISSNTLLLAGNEDWNYRGTVFAVWDLLEKLGCRWYFSGPYGEIIPQKKTLEYTGGWRVERPDFRIRQLWYSGWQPTDEQSQQWYRKWFDQQRLNGLKVSLPGDGSVIQLAPADKYYDSHPQIYALDKNGERMRDMLCMSDAETRSIAVETIKAHFRANPDAYSYGFAPPDGFPICYCKPCQRGLAGFMGKGYGDPSMSNLWFQFANAIAREVYQEFPDHWVLTNGYANRVRPPEGIKELAPNIGIQSAVISTCVLHATGDPGCWQRLHYEQIMNRWTDMLDCVFIYDYDPGNALDNLPHANLHTLEKDMPYFRDRGIWGFWTEGTNSWMVTHLNYYIRAKLMWDADADVKYLVREYCNTFYGAAGRAVNDYIWTLEQAVDDTEIHETWGRIMVWRVVLDPVAGQLEKLMAEAETLANTPEAQQRVQMLRWVHDHMMGYVAMERRAAEGDFQGAVDEIDKMFALRDKIEAVQPGMVPRDNKLSGGMRSSVTWHRTKYEALAKQMDGTEGNLVTLLPKTWQFKKDPEDIGSLYQWYLPGKTKGWSPIDSTLYWEAQGHQDEKGWGYSGKAWYRTTFDVPEDAAGKPLTLTIGAAYNGNEYNHGVWIWVNGMLREWEMDIHWRLGHHDVRRPIHVDVTDIIKPGETNHVAILVHTNKPGRNPRGGLHRRSFLWSPKE